MNAFEHDLNLCRVFSAGIGRTGTYIALDTLTMEGEAEVVLTIYSKYVKINGHLMLPRFFLTHKYKQFFT